MAKYFNNNHSSNNNNMLFITKLVYACIYSSHHNMFIYSLLGGISSKIELFFVEKTFF